MLSAALSRLPGRSWADFPGDRDRRADHGEMDEALGEVPQQFARVRVEFLGVQADVVRQAHQLIHERGGLVSAPYPGERFDEPEGAAEEGALAAAEAILAGIAPEQRAASEFAP